MNPAYLQPGDSVYIALPISPTHHTREAAHAEGQQQADGVTADFARHGVTVASWSAHSLLSHPVVVAVFRKAPEQPEDAKP